MKTLFASRTTVNSGPWAIVLLPVCFLLSGFAGIVYQIAWTRQFALVFGTTEIAVTLVLAAYMAGLGLGAWLIQRFLPYIERPVLVYAALEIIIGLSAAVMVPELIAGCDWLLRNLYGQRATPPGADHLDGISFFYGAGTLIALAIPTLCMGATLPLLARHVVEHDRQTGPRVGLLLTSNIAGAVGGALAGTFSLLPALGLSRTLWSAAAVNLLAAALALTVSRPPSRRRAGFSAAWAAAGRASFSRPPSPVWILPLMLISGAVALFHEVLWTRLLTQVLGSSLHAFGLMLASFLGGLALGSAVGGTLARGRRWAVRSFVSSQMACALTAAGAYLLIDRLLPDSPGQTGNTLLAAAILVPIAFFSGATFPLAVRILARRAEDAAPAAARVYAWNTFGSILGALTGGFVLIPTLRFEGSIQFAVAASAGLAVAAAVLLERPSRGLSITVGVMALATIAVFRPPVPLSLLTASPLQISNKGRMLYYGVGRSASVIVLAQDGSLAFRTNGLPEAIVEMRGAAPHVSGEKWLVPIAILARPGTESLLLVGYGGGAILDRIPDTVRHIDVIEIEPRVIDANSATRALRKYDPLTDPRVNVVINDARAALNLTSRRYGAIVSQPSHPWTAAASHLYTREFLLQARSHLTDDGVFVQWMNLSFMDESLLRSFAATVLDVFAEARLYRPDPYTLVFVASPRPFESGSTPRDGPLGSARLAPEFFARVGISAPEDLITALAADRDSLREIGRNALLITDDRNRMATASAYRKGRSMSIDAADRLFAPYDPVRLANSPLFSPDRKVQRAFVAHRLAVKATVDRGARERLDQFAAALDPASAEGYEVNALKLAVDGDFDAAQDLVRQGLARYPDSDPLRYAYVKPWFARLARGTATREITAEAAKLTGSAGAVAQGRVLAERRRWSELEPLDDLLARVGWNDPWKLDAVTLRAQYRCQEEGSADIRKRRADEALDLLDEALAVQPVIMLYALRVQCSLAAHRTDVVVESIWEYGHGLFANNRLPGVTDLEKQNRLQTQSALRELLQLLNKQTGADTARVAEVRDRLTGDVRELSN